MRTAVELYAAIGVVVLVVIVVIIAAKKKSSSTSPLTPLTPPTPLLTPLTPTIVKAFTGWAQGGNPYYMDYANPANQKWNGMISSDTVPIQCESSRSATQCETDLATAGQICDSTSGCIGIIYNIADPTLPTAVPVNSTPTPLTTTFSSTADGGGAIFLTPTVPTNPYLSFTGGDEYKMADKHTRERYCDWRRWSHDRIAC